MLEGLKALFVIAVVSTAAFAYARMAFSDIVPPATLGRWRNLYLAVTALTFLVPNYWLMLAALTAAMLALGASEKFRPALYLLLLFAVPAASRIVPGFAGINNFLEIYPFNVLAIVILFPLLFKPGETRGGAGGSLADTAFIGYMLVIFALAFRDTSFTDGVRRATAFLLTAVPQYFVFSRIRWTLPGLRLATAALVIPLVALSGVALVEAALGWHVYNGAVHNWGGDATLRYVQRSGFLRAYGTVFGPIAFGLFLAVGLALAPALAAGARKKRLAYLSLPAIAVGLLATFSRGPWIGGGLALATYVATTRRAIANMARAAIIGAGGVLLLGLTPFGGNLLNLLPFIGETEEGTIDYRQRLFEVGWRVVMKNPMFGSETYMKSEEMQSLVQGQGIIDIVNSYLRIALDSGLIGLSLYLGVVIFSLVAVWRSIGQARRIEEELAAYSQAYFAALLSLSIVLATTGNTIAQTQEVTWVLCGICVGIARSVSLERRAKETSKQAPAGAQEPEPEGAPAAKAPPSRPLPPHLRQYERR